MTTLRTPKKPAQKDWHKADIKAAIEKAGYTLRGLSRLHGVSAAYFAEALNRPIPRAQSILAQVIGAPATRIWPSRYEADGSPKRGLYYQSHKNGCDYQARKVRKSTVARQDNFQTRAALS